MGAVGAARKLLEWCREAAQPEYAALPEVGSDGVVAQLRG